MKHSGTVRHGESSTFADAGDAFNLYGYNDRSELTEARRYFGANLSQTTNPVGGQAYAYDYDNIGNRETAHQGAVSAEREESYSANNLNQYTSRTVPGYVDVLGTANTAATVTVNNQAVTRQNTYWHKTLTVTNTAQAAYPPVQAVGVRKNAGTSQVDVVTTETGHVFVAQTPEAFGYDDDGNLTNDGRFAYSWDAENRLIAMETATNVGGQVKVEFGYDFQGRRYKKVRYAWDGAWVPVQTNLFLYDGWLLVCEQSAVASGGGGNLSTNYYVNGQDLSGTLQGAGGIGGLLATVRSGDPEPVEGLYTFDGNGNVSEVVSTGGTVAAHYEYSPYGETIVATGSEAARNPIRFSTKYQDNETGLYYYGYRYYDAGLGRWTGRDPIGQEALFLFHFNFETPPKPASDPFGPYVVGDEDYDPVYAISIGTAVLVSVPSDGALYVFLHNDPVNLWEFLGLVDLNKFPVKQNIKKYADKAKTTDGSFSVGAHSTSVGAKVLDQNGNSIAAKDLAKEILANPNYKPGQTVTLASCMAGKDSNTYAQALADELTKQSCKETMVRAPDKFAWFNSKGKVWSAERNADGTPGAEGSWLKFKGSTK